MPRPSPADASSRASSDAGQCSFHQTDNLLLRTLREQHQLMQEWLLQWEHRNLEQMQQLRLELRGQRPGIIPVNPTSMASEQKDTGSPERTFGSETSGMGSSSGNPAKGRGRVDMGMEVGDLSIPSDKQLMNKMTTKKLADDPEVSNKLATMIPQINTKENHHLARLHAVKSKKFGVQRKRKGVMSAEGSRSFLIEIVEGAKWKAVVSVLILLNTIFIGCEVDISMKYILESPPRDMPGWFPWCNRVFAVAFAIEIIVRIAAHELGFFFGHEWSWNLFDTFLVVSSIVEEFISGVNMSQVRIIRVLRVVRTLRIIRVVSFFRQLRMMVCCISNSLMSLMWALLLLGLLMYLFSIVFVQGAQSYLENGASTETMTSDDLPDAEMKESIVLHYRSLLRAVFSLLMAISGGLDWYDVLHPLIRIHWMYPVFFSIYVLFVLLGVLNVLAAVFVENALQIRDRDLLIQSEIERTNEFLKDMSELFKEADMDSSSVMTFEELTRYLSEERVMAYMAGHQLDVSDITNMFHLLDTNNDNCVELSEFVLGTMRLKGQARCLDVIRLFQCFDFVQTQLECIERALGIQVQTIPAHLTTSGILDHHRE